MNELEISKMLTCSTAHLSLDTAHALNEQQEEGLPISYNFDYGWLVWAVSRESDSFDPERHPELTALLDFALFYDCEWVKIDRDGLVIEELPTF